MAVSHSADAYSSDSYNRAVAEWLRRDHSSSEDFELLLALHEEAEAASEIGDDRGAEEPNPWAPAG